MRVDGSRLVIPADHVVWLEVLVGFVTLRLVCVCVSVSVTSVFADVGTPRLSCETDVTLAVTHKRLVLWCLLHN